MTKRQKELGQFVQAPSQFKGRRDFPCQALPWLAKGVACDGVLFLFKVVFIFDKCRVIKDIKFFISTTFN